MPTTRTPLGALSPPRLRCASPRGSEGGGAGRGCGVEAPSRSLPYLLLVSAWVFAGCGDEPSGGSPAAEDAASPPPDSVGTDADPPADAGLGSACTDLLLESAGLSVHRCASGAGFSLSHAGGPVLGEVALSVTRAGRWWPLADWPSATWRGVDEARIAARFAGREDLPDVEVALELAGGALVLALGQDQGGPAGFDGWRMIARVGLEHAAAELPPAAVRPFLVTAGPAGALLIGAIGPGGPRFRLGAPEGSPGGAAAPWVEASAAPPPEGAWFAPAPLVVRIGASAEAVRATHMSALSVAAAAPPPRGPAGGGVRARRSGAWPIRPP